MIFNQTFFNFLETSCPPKFCLLSQVFWFSFTKQTLEQKLQIISFIVIYFFITNLAHGAKLFRR